MTCKLCNDTGARWIGMVEKICECQSPPTAQPSPAEPDLTAWVQQEAQAFAERLMQRIAKAAGIQPRSR